MTSEEICIGIDLGTTYSCVAVQLNDKIIIIENEQGNRITPSYVTITDTEIIVGDLSKSQISKYPTNTIYDIKRLMGQNFSDEQVQNEIKHLPFKVFGDENDRPYIDINSKKYYPEYISALILTKMKTIAESYLNIEIKNTVITVPAYFNDAQRQATKNAATIAKLNCVRIINEPTSAALAYGLNKSGENNILIFDLGGGTLDVSILNIENNLFSVKATSGDTHLGGEDFDIKIVEYCLNEFCLLNKCSIDNISKNKKITNRLKKEAEIAKKNLSSAFQTTINIENFCDGCDLDIIITRSKFESLCDTYFKRCFIPIEKALNDAHMDHDMITDVVLIGGSTRIPKIRSLIKEYFNKEPKIDINPDEAVAYGAAIQGSLLMNKDDKLTGDLILIDVIPLTVGIETAGGIMTPMIKRNSSIPCEREEIFSTYSDNQPNVTVKIYEGERSLVCDNNLLGKFILTEIPPMPRGIPKIKVKFNIDIDGLLSVSASEASSGVNKKIIIKNDNKRLSKEELQVMYKNAERNSHNDKEIKEKIELKNSFESYIYNAKNYILDMKINDEHSENFDKLKNIVITSVHWLDKLSADYKKEEIEEKFNEVRNSISELIKLVSK